MSLMLYQCIYIFAFSTCFCTESEAFQCLVWFKHILFITRHDKGIGQSKKLCLALLMFKYIVKGSLTDTHLKGLKSDRISYLLDTKVISGWGHQMLHTYIRHNIRHYVSKFQSSGKKKTLQKHFEKNYTTYNHKLHPPPPPPPPPKKKETKIHTHTYDLLIMFKCICKGNLILGYF